jgi:oligoribonuclease
MDPVVVEMHTKSNLLPLIRASTVTIEDAGAATLAFIRAHVPDPRTVPLCGNSIGTDRRFLDKYLPEIENYLHYRSVDVSSVKELVKRWYPDLTAAMPRKAGLHRALDDIRSSIEELRYYRGVVFVPPGAVEAEAEEVTAADISVAAAEAEGPAEPHGR